jgi:TRAP-type C4-dicarboxylate transport system substrate-binding protein
MKKVLISILTLLFVISFGISTALAEMELKGVSFVPRDHAIAAMCHVWLDRVNAEMKGVVKFNWIGGPEVIPPFDQAEALRKGVVQFGFLPSAYYLGLLPDADMISISKYDYKKEREKGGLFDYYVERHKTINMMLLGTWCYDSFYLRVNKPVKELSDLKGIKMRTAAKYDKMMLKLGIVPVTVQFGEVYTALQRGVVEGFGWSGLGPREWGWLEYCKYLIDIPFYPRQNTLILMNLDIWNKLSKKDQDKIMDITKKFEPDMKAYFEKKLENEFNVEYPKIGVVKVKFSPEDRKKFLDTSVDALWEDVEKKVPEQAKILRKIMGY